MKQTRRGGKRDGAGRKKVYDEGWTTIAIPKSLKPAVKNLVEEDKQCRVKDADEDGRNGKNG